MATKAEIDSKTWDFTCAALDKLAEIAREAKEASKAPGLSLAQKLDLQGIASKAAAGQRAVAGIFSVKA